MGRSSGTYTLPNAAFQINTPVNPTPVNGNFSDIAAALTDSVAADGQTPIVGPITFATGSAAAPSLTFTGDKTTGFYLVSAGEIGVAVSGSAVGNIQSSGLNGFTLQAPTISGNVAGTFTLTGALTVGSTSVTFNTTTYNWGAGAAAAFVSSLNMNSAIEYVIDGGGSVPATGVKGFIEVPFACTIKRVSLVADQSGSAVVDIWNAAYASFPPVVGNTITASALPTLSSAQKYQDSTLSGWTTSLAAGSWLAFNLNSATTVTRLTLSLLVQRTGL
jgi:hypothetical protein